MKRLRAKAVIAFLEREEKHPSELLRRCQLQILMNVTAGAFRARSHIILHLPARKALKVYGLFTKKCMEQTKADSGRLYAVSWKLGRLIRLLSGLSAPEELQKLVFLLYRNIGIRMKGRLPGEIIIDKCFFSHIYTPSECALIDAMDRGIVEGICGGGMLIFTQRITQGCDNCRALLG